MLPTIIILSRFRVRKLIKKLYTMSIKTFYTSPEISVRQMNVERGFAESFISTIASKNKMYELRSAGEDDEFEN